MKVCHSKLIFALSDCIVSLALTTSCFVGALLTNRLLTKATTSNSYVTHEFVGSAIKKLHFKPPDWLPSCIENQNCRPRTLFFITPLHYLSHLQAGHRGLYETM